MKPLPDSRRPNLPPPAGSQRGATLLELVMVILIVGILAAAGSIMLVKGVEAYSVTEESIDTLSKLRYATERAAREMREVRRNPATPTDYDIATRTAGTFRFTKTDGTTVTLTASPPLLTVAYSSPAVTATLTDEVSSAAFSYFQADGTTAATGNADIAFVELNLTLTSALGNNYSQRTRVALRNRQ